MVLLGSRVRLVRWGRRACKVQLVLEESPVRSADRVHRGRLVRKARQVQWGSKDRWVHKVYVGILMDRLPTNCWHPWPINTCRKEVAEGSSAV